MTDLMLEDIATRLMDLSIGVYSAEGYYGGDIYILRMPNNQNDCICLYQYAGAPRLNKALDTIQRPGLQIVVRSSSSLDALWRLDKIVTALDQTSFTINGVFYPSVIAKQEPFFLKTDEKDRFYYTVNFAVHRRKK